MNKFFISSLMLAMAGCASVSSVDDADNTGTINTLGMSCSSPYLLEQDCSIWSGATRKIKINDYDVKVGASEDGKIILVMDAEFLRMTATEFYTLNNPTHSVAVNNSFVIVKKVLNKNNVKINRVRALKSLGNIDGYVMELDKDGYSLLKKFTVK